MSSEKPPAKQCRRDQVALTTATSNNDAAGQNFLDFLTSLHMSEKMWAFYQSKSFHVASQELACAPIAVTCDPEDTRYIISELRCIPSLVLKRTNAPFIHPGLYGGASHRYLDAVYCKEIAPKSLFSELLALDAETGPLIDLLAAAQGLILFLIQYIFDRERTWPAGPFFDLLGEWRAILFRSAASRIPGSSNPWHRWILAESVRRTILMSYLLGGTYSAWKDGWCAHEMFCEALPFSTRGALWLAATPEEWLAIADDGTLASAVNELVSFHEFTDTFARAPFDPGDDLFQELLLVAHHGKEPVESRSLRCRMAMI